MRRWYDRQYRSSLRVLCLLLPQTAPAIDDPRNIPAHDLLPTLNRWLAAAAPAGENANAHYERALRGRLPLELAHLLPELFSELPADPFSGAPLRFRVESDGSGFHLWSVGPDFQDDHGAPGGEQIIGTEEAPPTGDIVLWPPSAPDFTSE